ncbi:MAG: hypothetical protein WC080_00685 [Patescibacteria group bacterium]
MKRGIERGGVSADELSEYEEMGVPEPDNPVSRQLAKGEQIEGTQNPGRPISHELQQRAAEAQVETAEHTEEITREQERAREEEQRRIAEVRSSIEATPESDGPIEEN